MYKIFIVATLLLLSACKPQNPAPIEYNHNKASSKDGHSSYSERTVRAVDDGEINAKPLNIAEKEDYDKASGVLIAPKEKEIKDDRPDEVAILPPAKPDNSKIIYHEVEDGETLEQIADNYEQKPDDIATLNELSEPYKLEEFQILKIKVSSDVLNKRNKEYAKNLTNKRAETSVPVPVHLSHDGMEQGSKVFVKPLEGSIISKFGAQLNGSKNNGVNIAASVGTGIQSIADGTVVYAGDDPKFGNLVIIKLNETKDKPIFVAYAHMTDLLLSKDMPVKQGQVIGHVGSTGNVDSPQLYFAIREDKTAVDPEKYVKW